jgi:hypothetical protein
VNIGQRLTDLANEVFLGLHIRFHRAPNIVKFVISSDKKDKGPVSGAPRQEDLIAFQLGNPNISSQN